MKRHLQIAHAVGVVLLLTVVAGGTPLGPDLSRRTTDVMRSVQLAVGDELMEETVDVDQEKGTEIFRTVSSTGTSFVIMDMKNGLSAYRFDGDEKCYILDAGLEDAEDTAELSEDLGHMQEGEVDPAERLSETFLSVGGEGGKVEPSELSESVAEFCEGLQAYRADKSSTRPTATPEESVEEEGLPERNVHRQGSNAEQELEKRFLPNPAKLLPNPAKLLPNPASLIPNPAKLLPNPASLIPNPAKLLPNPAKLIPNPASLIPNPAKLIPKPASILAKLPTQQVCEWLTKNVCDRSCTWACGKRRRRDLVDGVPVQVLKKLARRGWFGDILTKAKNKVTGAIKGACKNVCNWGCRPVRTWVCKKVG